jgi:hypothetical protein
MKFREFARRRLMEDMQLDINSLRSMILKALGANPENQDAWNSPLVQFAEPQEIIRRLNSLKGLEQLIATNSAAQMAIQKAPQTQLTVGDLSQILLAQQ